jgi:hypothetical protein
VIAFLYVFTGNIKDKIIVIAFLYVVTGNIKEKIILIAFLYVVTGNIKDKIIVIAFLYVVTENIKDNIIMIEEEFEYTKRVIRIRKSKKNRQHNGQKKKYKKTNKDLQNIQIKLKIALLHVVTENIEDRIIVTAFMYVVSLK